MTPLPLQPWRPVYGRQCLLFFNFPSFSPSLPPFLLSFPPSFFSPSFSYFLPPSPPPTFSSSLPPSFFLPPFRPSFPPVLLSSFFWENISLTYSPLSGIIPLAFQLLPRTVWQLDILQENQRWESKETEHLLPKEEASSQVQEIDSSHHKHTPVVHVFFICFQKTIFIIDPWCLFDPCLLILVHFVKLDDSALSGS